MPAPRRSLLRAAAGGDDVLAGTSVTTCSTAEAGRDVLHGDRGRDVCRAGEDVHGCESLG